MECRKLCASMRYSSRCLLRFRYHARDACLSERLAKQTPLVLSFGFYFLDFVKTAPQKSITNAQANEHLHVFSSRKSLETDRSLLSWVVFASFILFELPQLIRKDGQAFYSHCRICTCSIYLIWTHNEAASRSQECTTSGAGRLPGCRLIRAQSETPQSSSWLLPQTSTSERRAISRYIRWSCCQSSSSRNLRCIYRSKLVNICPILSAKL